MFTSTALAVLMAVVSAGPVAAAPDTTPPPTPLTFLVTNVTATQVSMQWTPGYLTEPTGWRVFRNGAAVSAAASSAYTDRNLVPGATYSYHVVAYDRAGNTSAPTRTITVTTRGPGVVPGAPTNLRVRTLDPARVTLEFDRPGDEFDVSQYRVFDGGTQVAVAVKHPYAGATASVNVRRLVPGSSHSYTVRAYRPGFDLSAPTDTLAVTLPATTDTQAPSVPTALVATVSRYSCDFADLRWTQSVDGTDAQAAIDYEIFTDGAFNHVLRGVGLSTNIQFFNHGTHTLAISAVDGSGNASARSAAVTFTVDPFCQLEG